MQSNGSPGSAGLDLSPIATATLLACGMFTTIGLFSPGLVLPQIERHFHAVPHAALLTELVGTIASFAFAIGSPLGGALIARVGVRAVLVPALLIFAAVGALPAALDNIWAILAARLALGFVLGAIFTGALAGLGSLPAERRARMFGWFAVVGGGAAIGMFPLVGALGKIGWQPPFLLNLLALPVAALALRLPQGLAMAGEPTRTERAEGAAERPLLNGSMAWLLVIAALAGMSMLIAPIYSGLRLTELGVTDTATIAIPATIGSIAAVLASATYGWLHPRIGSHGVTALAMLVIAAMLAVAGLTMTAVVFGAAVVVQSAMVALIAPNVSATALEIAPAGKGAQAMGLANGMMFGAQLAFPFIAAPIRAEAGLGGVFLVFCGAALACGLGTLAMRRKATPAGAAAGGPVSSTP